MNRLKNKKYKNSTKGQKVYLKSNLKRNSISIMNKTNHEKIENLI